MSRQVEETPLPGVGIRFTFTTSDGATVSVLHHRDGRRALFVAGPRDPDASREVVDLDPADSRVLAELLGASQVVQDLRNLQQQIEGIAIDWLMVEAGSPAAGRAIGQLRVRSTTGVTIVAILRDGRTLPVPEPTEQLEAGDMAVVLGAPDNIRRVRDLLRGA